MDFIQYFIEKSAVVLEEKPSCLTIYLKQGLLSVRSNSTMAVPKFLYLTSIVKTILDKGLLIFAG
jgi:hypothetical protein